MSNRSKQILKIFFIAVMMAAIFAQPVSAQDRCHANVTKVAGTCVYDGSTSTWQVKINLYGYKVSFKADPTNLTFENKESNNKDFYINLAEGTYEYDRWEWVNGAWVSRGTGSITLEGCALPHASGSASLGTCTPGDPGTNSVTDVNISVDHAVLLINGGSYDTSTTIPLGPGSYPWSWSAVGDYWGSGGGTLDVGNCTPKYQADVQFGVDACAWGGDGFERNVVLTIAGASVTLTGAGGPYGPYTSSQTIKLPVGDYGYSWSAVEPGYEGEGSGTLSLPECDQTKADAAANIGSCSYNDGKSLTVVDIVVQNAIFTIDGNDYTESATLKFSPGDYPYSWGPVSGEYTGSGEGILTVGVCNPKQNEDPSVDVAAGGSGPSLLVSITPMMTLVGGLGIAWVVTEQSKVRKTK